MLASLLLGLSLVHGIPGGDIVPDRLVLADGTDLACRVLFEDADHVVVREASKTRELARAEVAEINSIERSLAEFLERFDALDVNGLGDAAALVDLAHFAETHRLAGEARATWFRILTLDPENEEAWAYLGGRERRRGWQLEVRGHWRSLDELRAPVADCKDALELPTAHFLVKSDVGLDRALAAALDAERTFAVFQEVVGKPLELFVLEDVPTIHIHSDASGTPAPPAPGQRAWYSLLDNTLHVHAGEDIEPGPVAAEFVDALLFNSLRRSLDVQVGELEPWVREGLRQIFAAALQFEPGRVSFEFDAPQTLPFEVLAWDPEPMRLGPILGAGYNGFETGTNLVRMQAGAYTFTWFLVQNPAYRQGLGEFLRSAYLGKGGKSNFLATLGVSEKELELEWHAYVRRVAAGGA